MSRSKQLKEFHFFQVDISITWLMIEQGRFKAILESSTDKRWTALQNFIHYYSEKMSLQVHPLPFFGEAYYSFGSYSYYKRLKLRLAKEYYVLSFDHTDPCVFWPLSLHEIAHCWLSNRDYVDQICSRHMPEFRGIEEDYAESRVEEVLCDAIATRVIGPAYPYAFVSRLWALFPAEVAPDYPSYAYRVKCMASVLNHQGFDEEARALEEIMDQKFEDSWRNEKISSTLDDVLSVTNALQSPSANKVKDAVKGILTKVGARSSEDLSSLFLAVWLMINNAGSDIALVIDKTSEIILSILGGYPIPSDA